MFTFFSRIKTLNLQKIEHNKGAQLTSVMSIDFSTDLPSGEVAEPVTDIGDLEPVSWEIMNNNNAIDVQKSDTEKMTDLTGIQLVQMEENTGKLEIFDCYTVLKHYSKLK